MATGEDRQESALDVSSDCGWVRALDASGKSIRISKDDIVELIRINMPLATSENIGLMGTDNIFHRGNLMINNLQEVGSSFGYAYGDHGSGLAGTFLSIKDSVSGIQFKANYIGTRLSFRVFNYRDGVWSDWKSISFT